MLVLSERDILKCVSYSDIVNAIEESFIVYEQKDFHMPNRMHIDHAAKESGDVLYPLVQKWVAPNQVHTLGSLIKAGGAGDAVKNKTTFFKSVGMALFDLAAAGVIYAKALEKGIGQELVL